MSSNKRIYVQVFVKDTEIRMMCHFKIVGFGLKSEKHCLTRCLLWMASLWFQWYCEEICSPDQDIANCWLFCGFYGRSYPLILHPVVVTGSL